MSVASLSTVGLLASSSPQTNVTARRPSTSGFAHDVESGLIEGFEDLGALGPFSYLLLTGSRMTQGKGGEVRVEGVGAVHDHSSGKVAGAADGVLGDWPRGCQNDDLCKAGGYSLTPYGKTLAPITELMCQWGKKHLSRLKEEQAG
jgi:hypothetical protein